MDVDSAIASCSRLLLPAVIDGEAAIKDDYPEEVEHCPWLRCGFI